MPSKAPTDRAAVAAPSVIEQAPHRSPGCVRALGSGSPQATQSGGLKQATCAQQPAHTAPSSGRSSTRPQVAQHGASSTASAAFASARHIT